MTRLTAAGRSLRRYRWEHPEWWLLALSGLAWTLLSVTALGAILDPGAPSAHLGHDQHAGAAPPSVGASGGPNLAVGLASWSLMVTAMMLPLAGPDARRLAHRSLASRRRRTVGLHVTGFLGVWIVLGAVSLLVLSLAKPPATAVAGGLLVAAAVWHLSPIRRRAFRRCGAGRLPAVRGLRADADCLDGGARSALRCLVTCGLPMLSMAAVHSLPLMAMLTMLGLSERRPGPNAERRIGRPLEAAGIMAGVVLVAIGT